MSIRSGSSQDTRRLRWLALGVMVYPVQAVLVHGLGRTSSSNWLPLLLPLAHLLLLPFLLKNFSFWGIRLVLAGLLLNLTVMMANGGLMPVEASAVQAVSGVDTSDLQIGDYIPGSKDKLMSREDVRLREFSDVIVPPVPHFTTAISVGDLLAFGGVLVTIGELSGRKHKRTAVR